MKTNFVAHLALAVLILLLSNCKQEVKNQQITSRPSLSTLAKANPLQLGYHEMTAADMMNSKSIRLLPAGKEGIVVASFLKDFVVYRNVDNNTIYIRRKSQSPLNEGTLSEHGYLMRSFDCAGSGVMQPMLPSSDLVFECHDTEYYGAIGTTYLAHAIGEAGGNLIIKYEGRRSYLAGEELECALSLTESANDGLCKAAMREPTGWLRSF